MKILLIILLILILIYLVCYRTKLRYKKPFCYTALSKTLWQHDLHNLSFHLKRNNFFAIGFHYEKTLDDPITYDEYDNGHYSRKWEYTLYLGWTYFTLTIKKKWEELKK